MCKWKGSVQGLLTGRSAVGTETNNGSLPSLTQARVGNPSTVYTQHYYRGLLE